MALMRSDPVFKIVTAYADLAAGVRAKAMVERLAAELRPRLEIENDLWKFELLSHGPLRQCSAGAAAEADMVLIAAPGAAELPDPVRNWIEDWLAWKRKGPCALVALLSVKEKAPGLPPPLGAWLRQIARMSHLDFFCKTGDWWREDFEYYVDTIRRRSERRSAVLEEMLHLELRSQLQRARRAAIRLFGLQRNPQRFEVAVAA